VQTSAGIIFFIKTFVTLFNKFIAWESVFYGWRWVLIPWSLYQLIYGLTLIGGSIAYLVLSQEAQNADFQSQWDSLSTFGRLFYSNSIDNMKFTYQTNMIIITSFAMFEGVLYVIEALLSFILVFMIPKGWVPKV
jgi:hypothetical protein